MARQNDIIDWSDFTETEQQAIAIHFDNVANGTDNPTFPYSAAAFTELAENLASIALIKPNSALKMVEELKALNNVLLKQIPLPPTRDVNKLVAILTDEEIQQNILSCNVGFFLVKQFSHIINHILFALEAENAGGGNGTKH
ncbi:hypothetical protein E4T80_11630 [Muribacter muris]|uniref:Uncharacterized protein n=1 Tax=Muribacter muris TaxID=67855 RepID=A0A4Y9JTB0_9PAST|nr:hypothetical protein [Muribacter muris]MBF0786113.1 hypothetical protein [Muribacter muris]MBF0826466.1 hypothetical protein [Muribacter muris]TFV07950.1 hypothetical protein E4T80_11630 [Muribacter muris]